MKTETLLKIHKDKMKSENTKKSTRLKWKVKTLLQIHEDKMKSETLKNPPGDADLRVWHLSN